MPTRIDPAQIPAAPNLEFESALWQQSLRLAAGLDEAGRGAWAGPVAAAAVILPDNAVIAEKLFGVRDSKELTPIERERLAERIHKVALTFGTGLASAAEIDAMGILPATRLAMARALAGLSQIPDHLLIDALFLPDLAIPQTSLIKGDQRSLSIAAASILAKTARDALMREFDHDYPFYGFTRHKGYGTRAHREAIEKVGPCALHRMSFSPLKKKVPVVNRHLLWNYSSFCLFFLLVNTLTISLVSSATMDGMSSSGRMMYHSVRLSGTVWKMGFRNGT